jgi:outer membrane protein TolC
VKAFAVVLWLPAAAAAAVPAVPPVAAPPRLEVSLDAAERAALEYSPLLKAAESDLAGALKQADAQMALLAPRAALDGSYQYQTQVPRFSFVPGAPPQQFGDHEGWAIGPSLSYTLWDFGALSSAWRSQKALARSQEAQRDLVRRQVRLMTRLGYFQVQLALEQERSLADSLALAQAQYADISSRRRAGAVSRIDWLSAHQQVLERLRGLRSAQADVGAALRNLFALTGQGQGADLSAPLDARIERAPVGLSTPTATVALEALDAVEARLSAAAAAGLDEAHPQLLVYGDLAEAQRLAARGTAAGLWPRVQAGFKSYYQYPNLPLRESVWQNTALVAASVPLFELGRTRSLAAGQRAQADAAERRRDDARDSLERDWRKARDRYQALRDQEALDRQAVDETEEIARLRYSSYREGASTILDVTAANISAVQTRVEAARTKAQALIQLATLDSLSAAR